jgi:hypothetical protein
MLSQALEMLALQLRSVVGELDAGCFERPLDRVEMRNGDWGSPSTLSALCSREFLGLP